MAVWIRDFKTKVIEFLRFLSLESKAKQFNEFIYARVFTTAR